MHRTYSLRYGSFYIRKLIRTRFFAHHRRNIRKYNIRFTLIRYCVTVVMYRCEMASQRNKNQCHSSYRFWIIWFLPRLHVESKMLDFDGSGYFANCTITWSVWKRFYLYSPILYRIELWRKRHINLSCSRYFSWDTVLSKCIKPSNQKNFLHYFSRNIRSMDCNRVVEDLGFWGPIFRKTFFLVFPKRQNIYQPSVIDNNSKNWKVGSMSISRRIRAWSPITEM